MYIIHRSFLAGSRGTSEISSHRTKNTEHMWEGHNDGVRSYEHPNQPKITRREDMTIHRQKR